MCKVDGEWTLEWLTKEADRSVAKLQEGNSVLAKLYQIIARHDKKDKEHVYARNLVSQPGCNILHILTVIIV